jgi:uncharacterized membrane protein
LPYGHAYAYTPPHAANLELPTSGELKRRSRASLRGNWTNAVLAILVYAGILVAIRLIPWPISGILQIVISGPLELGLAILFLAVTRAYPATLGRMFEGFHTMGTAINATMLRGLFIFLWSLPYFVACSGAIGYELMPPEGALLFFLPLLALGAVAFYSYRMVFYVIADRPGTGPLTAIRLSKRMMYGHKARLFRLDLSFIGWALLCVLSGGIGFLWLTPYMKASEIAFYDDMRARTGFV